MTGHARRRGCHGFTLIETLIALVVLMVGMLGVSILMVEGLRLHRNAVYQSRAVSLAADLAERLRAAGTGDFADSERGRWRQDVATQLPGGAMAKIGVTPAAKPGLTKRYDISLQWPEAGGRRPASISLAIQLPTR